MSTYFMEQSEHKVLCELIPLPERSEDYGIYNKGL